jgi:hypothetical protein
MDVEPLPLPPEFIQALAANGGQPLIFEDPETLQTYMLVKEQVEITLDDEYINRKLAEGLADVEAGRVGPWDPERIKREGRRLLAERREEK